MYRVSLFGEFSLEDDEGNALKLATRKAQLLLSFLLLRSEQAHSRERLVDIFWPDSSEQRGMQSIRHALYSIRAVLEPDEAMRGRYIISQAQTIQYAQNDLLWVDVHEFMKSLEQSEGDVSDDEKLELLNGALDLYADELLTGCYDDWCLEEREFYRAAYLRVLKNLMELHTRRDEYELAVGVAQESLKVDPLQDRIHHELIALHAAQGDRAAAIQQYHECERILREELDVEPLPETQLLFQELQSRSATPRFAEIADRSEKSALAFPRLGAPFIDRDSEIERLVTAMNNVFKGQGQSIWISGEAGIGKSRLIQEFLQFASQKEMCILQCRCYDIEGSLPFQPLIEAIRGSLGIIEANVIERVPERALREVLKLVPDLEEQFPGIEASSPLTSPDQERNRLFEGLLQFFTSLASAQALVLFVDDLQWADESTTGFIHYLSRNLSEHALLFLGCYREEEIDEGHPLWEILQHLIRDRLVEELRLPPFDAPLVKELVNRLLDTTELDQFGERLYENSKGFPFYVEELVKSSIEDGSLSYDDDDGIWKVDPSPRSPERVPSTLRALVGTRLRRISSAGRQFLDLAAVSGHSFTPHLVSQALGKRRSEALMSIGELLERRFLDEENENFYFRHDVVRQVVYDGIQPERRRLLHMQIGEALEELHAETKPENGVLGDLALHFFNAEKWAKAMGYSLSAAQQAWSKHYAKEEAIRFFTRALDLAQRLGDRDSQMLAHKGLGEVCATTDEQDVGLEHCLKALELCDEAEARAEIYLSIASVHHHQGEMEKGLDYCQQALDEIGRETHSPITVKAYHRAITFLNWLHRYDEAIEHSNRALKILDELPEKYLYVYILSNLGQAYSGRKNFDEAIKFLAETTQHAEETGDLDLIGVAYFKLGIALHESMRTDEAISAWNESIHAIKQLSGRYGDLAAIYNYLLYAHLLIDDVPEAIKCAEEELRLYGASANRRRRAASLAILGSLYDAMGDSEASENSFNLALELDSESDLTYHSAVIIYLYLENVEKAIQWLEKGSPYLKDHHFDYLLNCPSYKPSFDALRSDERFLKLLESN